MVTETGLKWQDDGKSVLLQVSAGEPMSRTFSPERIVELIEREARALLHDLRLGDQVAVRAFYLLDCESSRARLADAQYIIARKYGFKSWQYLKQRLVGEKSTASSFPRGDQTGL